MRIKTADDFARAFHVKHDVMSRLETYAALLVRWQKTHNLVAPSTLPDLWYRHMADSAQLIAHAGGARRWIDLGSGAGFPGMVAAIMLRGHCEVQLVESNAKKCAFLAAVNRETDAHALIHNCRIEEAANRIAGPFDIVSARALASLEQLCTFAAPFMAEGSNALFPKGREVKAEIADAEQSWNLVYDERPSLTDPDGRILIVHSLKRL